MHALVRLAGELEELFGAPRADIVLLPPANPFLALDVLRGELLYCADPHAQAEYELYVLRRAGDLAPFQRARHELVLSSYDNDSFETERGGRRREVCAWVQEMVEEIRALPLGSFGKFPQARLHAGEGTCAFGRLLMRPVGPPRYRLQWTCLEALNAS